MLGKSIIEERLELRDIMGQYHAKRACEVALAGGHSVTFVGAGIEAAKQLAQWCQEHELVATAMKECPCGGFNNLKVDCSCSAVELHGWWDSPEWQEALEADIVIEVPVWLREEAPGGESDFDILARIEGMGSLTILGGGLSKSAARRIILQSYGLALDETCEMLLKVAVRQLNMDEGKTYQTMEVAATIAALAHSERVGAAHLAEAIQYRPRIEMRKRSARKKGGKKDES